jgi:hypothetical protein
MGDSRHTPNELFREARVRLFGTREALADAVNVHLAPAFLISANDIGKIERGIVTYPRSPRRAAFRRALGVETDHAIGFHNSRGAPPPASDTATNSESPRVAFAIYGNGSDLRIAAAHGRATASRSPVPIEPIQSLWNPAGLTPHRPGDSWQLADPAGPPEWYLVTPPGRALAGSAIPVQLHPAVLGDQVMARVPEGYAENPFIQRPGRALVVGQVSEPDVGTFVLDSRHARRRLRGVPVDARLPIPPAYRLDELTFALLWTVANFDEALLADDAVIAASMQEATGYTKMAKSAVSRDMATDASPASLMWLGSMFCADHIRRHMPDLTGTPVFWTREQRGEQAASWLLFTHKNEYLRNTSAGTGPGERLARAFCVPRDAVSNSPVGERALLLLAVALMESYGIHTAVTDAPELSATPGFAYDHHHRAITATWLGTDGIWYVDVADDRATLRGYGDAADYAIHHSVSAGATPHRRMRALADYLGLDWTWLVTRCAEIADWGSDGIAQPRSRLLSLAGFDRACQFLAEPLHSDS